MSSLSTRIKFLYEKFNRGSKTRKIQRDLRQTIIYENKRNLARDLAQGHNLKDFSIDSIDLPAIMKAIEKGKGSTTIELRNLYYKYRGR